MAYRTNDREPGILFGYDNRGRFHPRANYWNQPAWGYGSGGYGAPYGPHFGSSWYGGAPADRGIGFGPAPGFGGARPGPLGAYRDGGGYGGGSGPARYAGYGAEGAFGAGRRSFAGVGPRSYARPEERIREDINDRLTAHPGIDATDVEVDVAAGEVTLTGEVSSRHAKRTAGEIAETTYGVREVRNDLQIEPPWIEAPQRVSEPRRGEPSGQEHAAPRREAPRGSRAPQGPARRERAQGGRAEGRTQRTRTTPSRGGGRRGAS